MTTWPRRARMACVHQCAPVYARTWTAVRHDASGAGAQCQELARAVRQQAHACAKRRSLSSAASTPTPCLPIPLAVQELTEGGCGSGGRPRCMSTGCRTPGTWNGARPGLEQNSKGGEQMIAGPPPCMHVHLMFVRWSQGKADRPCASCLNQRPQNTRKNAYLHANGQRPAPNLCSPCVHEARPHAPQPARVLGARRHHVQRHHAVQQARHLHACVHVQHSRMSRCKANACQASRECETHTRARHE